LAAFEKFDADKDGKITVEETVKLLEENGMSVYEGHVSWVLNR
jgi:Ca2+-binding EF-hand superfamily protein